MTFEETFRTFLMTGLRDGIARGRADCITTDNAGGWFRLGVITQEDIIELNDLVQAKNNPPQPEPIPEPEVIDPGMTMPEDPLVEPPIPEELKPEQTPEGTEEPKTEPQPEAPNSSITK